MPPTLTLCAIAAMTEAYAEAAVVVLGGVVETTLALFFKVRDVAA